MGAATAPVRVALVDDHRLLAQVLALALQSNGYDAVLVDPADDVVERVRQWRAGVVLLDLNLGGAAGDPLIPPLARLSAVLVLTAETDPARWGECLRAGAVAVLPKADDVEQVLAAVAAASQGRPVVPDADRIAWLRASEQARRASEQRLAPFRRLTPREQAVLAALADGEAAAAIAGHDVVSEATVRTQIRSVLAKLGVTSQLQAVAAAHRAGWRPTSLS